MFNFKEFLEEQKKFANSNDFDYPGNTDILLVFDEKSGKEYKTIGKTHDAKSHAIKHLLEFEPDFVKNAIVKFIKNISKTDLLLFTKSKGIIETDRMNIINKVNSNKDIILNTFDMINDKSKNREKLNAHEQTGLGIIKELEKKYLDLINEKIKKSVELTPNSIENSIDKADVISYGGFQGSVYRTYYIDLLDNSVIITSPDYIRTLYSFYKPANSKAKVLKNALNQKLIPDDTAIHNGIRKYIGN